MGRRDFGAVRRLPSGRYQARYIDRNGVRHARTFATRGDASRYLAGVRADLDRGDWVDPTAGQVPFAEYAASWLTSRRVRGRPLAPRTAERYRSLLRTKINPSLGHMQLRFIEPSTVRAWHAGLCDPQQRLSPATTAKAYRLLHAIFASAVVEEEVPKNPCMIPGASAETSDERPTATANQVFAIADAIGDRWRALVLLATFCGLRFGELAALTVDRLDLEQRTVTVTQDLDELDGGVLQVGRVTSEASRRTVAIPEVIVPALERHVAEFAGDDGHVFVGSSGGLLRRSNFRTTWKAAVGAIGLPELRFHDLRHTGNTLAASTGASTRELMSRMGHASARASLIYQPATRDRDRLTADKLSAMVADVIAS